ncbi:hypothetical protein JZX87_09925 [Agrobacterium sp. Ap1]|uniref:hypothetical protein n=1 Tax=Agrobacterium sp. Ap1 TaxID=2815337 RepID=UPI001A8C7CDA|nr:hypothetical protein [Agrobacterium sp. Ap1]MBO0141480.1 hypothetical protein [Agrobacterium sp. Ap1]
MTELDLLREEIKDIEGDLFRIRGSLQKQDNGVKLSRIAIKTRTLDRLKRSLARLEVQA